MTYWTLELRFDDSQEAWAYYAWFLKQSGVTASEPEKHNEPGD